MFQAGLSAILAFQSHTIPGFIGKDIYSNDMDAVDSSIAPTLAVAQLLFVTVYCHRQGKVPVGPDPKGSFAYNLLLMMDFVDEDTRRPNPKYVL